MTSRRYSKPNGPKDPSNSLEKLRNEAVEKDPNEHFEIAAPFIEPLAMTGKTRFVSLRGVPWGRRSNLTSFNIARFLSQTSKNWWTMAGSTTIIAGLGELAVYDF
jgi:hypothetical protein